MIMNKPHLFKIEDWTPEEAGLLDEMKSRCLNKGQYIDEKAKDKFKMLCHLEDYGLQYYEQQQEIEILNNIIKSIKEEIETYIDVTIDHLETNNEEINFELRNKCRAMREIKEEILNIIEKELKER